MTANRATTRGLFLGPIVLAGLLALCFLRETPAQPPVKSPELDPQVIEFLKVIEEADGDSALQKKLKERHNAAVALLEERVSEYRSGSRELSAVLDAAKFVAEAKMSLADSPEAKISALERTLSVARLVEEQMQRQLDKGFGSKGDLARARLARLNVEVDLLKAKGG